MRPRLSLLVGAAPPQGTKDSVFGGRQADPTAADFDFLISGIQPRDLRPDVDEIEDQGVKSECVGEGWTTVLEVMREVRGFSHVELSPDFTYFAARDQIAQATRQAIQDQGTSAYIAAATLTQVGACPVELCPASKPVNDRPSDPAYAEAAKHKVTRWERLGKGSRDVIADMVVAIECRLPFVICLPLAESFFSISGAIATHPAQWTPTYIGAPNCIGAHCMAGIGWFWLNGQRVFILQNSWTQNWGDGGFVGIAENVIRSCAFDCFVARDFDEVQLEPIPLELYAWRTATQLADGRMVAVDPASNAGRLFRLYQAAFNRKPDESGLGYWIKALDANPLGDVAGSFVASLEFQSLYGALSSDAFVTQMYRNVLHREPDPSGLEFWSGHLSAGAITRAGVLESFSESAENKAATDPSITRGIVYQPFA